VKDNAQLTISRIVQCLSSHNCVFQHIIPSYPAQLHFLEVSGAMPPSREGLYVLVVHWSVIILKNHELFSHNCAAYTSQLKACQSF
jgi:hypothetical protein